MRKGVFGFFFFCLVSIGAAQGNLQFNQVLLVDSALQTVPANKVWKITGISGREYRLNECVDISNNSTHELKAARCGYITGVGSSSFRSNYFITLFWVNGKRNVVSVESLPTSSTQIFSHQNNCAGPTGSYFHFDCAKMLGSPHIFPMWLPSGSTLQTGGPNTTMSVLEFNIVP